MNCPKCKTKLNHLKDVLYKCNGDCNKYVKIIFYDREDNGIRTKEGLERLEGVPFEDDDPPGSKQFDIMGLSAPRYGGG